MEIKEIDEHLKFFNKSMEGIGNAFKFSIKINVSKTARKNAEQLLKERIGLTQNYVEQHNLRNAITDSVYSTDKSFELYELNNFERDVPKVIRWLESLKRIKEATSNEEE